MRQVLIRASYLLRRPAVVASLLVLGVGGSACVELPLLGLPGYELALAITLGVGVLGGCVGIAAARLESRLIQGKDPRPARALRQDSPLSSALCAMAAAFLLNCAALALPFLVAVGHALLRSACDPFAQAGFYPLLTLPSAWVASVAGVFCGLLSPRPMKALGAYLAVLLASAAWTAWPLVQGPQVFAFNLFGGYFPGPLYDEALRVPSSLYWFRLETLLASALGVAATALTLRMREGLLGRLHLRPGPALLALLAALGISGLEANAPRLGLRMTDEVLAEKLGGLRQSEHFLLYYPQSKPRLEVDRLVRDLEFRYAQVQAFLGGAPKGRLRVYVYRSAEEKKALVGAGQTQFAQPWRGALHINDAPFPHPSLKHELVHVMAAPLGSGPFRVTSRWGLLPVMAVVEGFAVAGDNPVGDLTLEEWAAAMRRQKLAPDVRKLLAAGNFYGASPQRAYVVAGAFLRFLSDTYGKEKLEALYAHGDFRAAYGAPLGELADAWEKSLDALPLDEHAVNRAFARFREGSLFVRSCAREVAELEGQAGSLLAADPERALQLYQRCATLQPDEPTYALGAAAALGALERPAEARQLLQQLAHKVDGQPALEAQVALALADVAWSLKLPQEAGAQLARVLELKPGPELERSAQVKLAALADAKAGPALWEYFQPAPDELRLLKLRLAWEAAPDNAYLNYLLGRRLLQAGVPALAAKHLATALGTSLPDALALEAWRLKLQAAYEAGDCASVRSDAGELPDFGTAFRATADEWRERCDFELQVFHAPLVPPDRFR